MSNLNEPNYVKQQYASANKLDIRISLHSKYSINKQGFGNWIFQQYAIASGNNILELGCGNGDMWIHNQLLLPQNCIVTLTDYSEGMLEKAKDSVGQAPNFKFQQANIQQIPYEDNHFDIVIANMMLYHVPDIHRGLSEVKRVLKNDGTFYCATFGENGVAEYLQDLLLDYDIQLGANKVFTLQNGATILENHFKNIEKRMYEDALEVTDTNDLIDYLFSLIPTNQIEQLPRNELFELLEKKKVNGKIHIPKEYGIFIVHK